MASGISADTTYALTAHGLNKGDRYEASVEYTPDDGSGGFNTGFSAQGVKNGGTITFSEEVTVLTNGNEAAGTLRGWIRLPGSGFSGAPIELDSGPAETEVHVP